MIWVWIKRAATIPWCLFVYWLINLMLHDIKWRWPEYTQNQQQIAIIVLAIVTTVGIVAAMLPWLPWETKSPAAA